ncbi:hypothetical protein [Chondrinema litorale]|uniref:hypothetical protein n=1 Tax=Chondrinema litorale TaxID=2994555 RepID=UPI0025435FDD|nr:hypothetical protein [Chondrinema litorale]UZR95362.1 hypothetical protein OQ292_05955 [Chondrinema litorale]
MEFEHDFIKYAINRLRKRFFHIPEIISIGVGKSRDSELARSSNSIIFSVDNIKTKNKLLLDGFIPAFFEGIPIKIQESPRFEILHNTLQSGAGIGHINGGNGTLGTFVKKDGIEYILSNNHVLANCNNGKQGDEIVFKKSRKNNRESAGYLYDFIHVHTETNRLVLSKIKDKLKLHLNTSTKLREPECYNYVDAALAIPIEKGNLNIPAIGLINIIKPATAGLIVRKYGNATGFTEGEIIQTAVTCKVKFGKKMAVFTDQIMCEMPNKPGDSGALLVSDNSAVGLVFSGNKNYLLANRIERVFGALKITF